VDASDVREEIKKIIDLYIKADMLRKLAYAKLLNLANEMIERLRDIEDPEAKKLLDKIERDKSLRTVIAILDRYERLMRKQEFFVKRSFFNPISPFDSMGILISLSSIQTL